MPKTKIFLLVLIISVLIALGSGIFFLLKNQGVESGKTPKVEPKIDNSNVAPVKPAPAGSGGAGPFLNNSK
jgi:hypothetical protein